MTMRVYRNEVVDWVVAESPEDASKAWEETCGDTYSVEDNGEWEAEPDDKLLKVEDDGGTTEQTCAEWVAAGRGFLCSTEF